MGRYRVSKGRSSRSFNKKSRRTHKKNLRAVYRGGIRL